jgi:hypothetical protein
MPFTSVHKLEENPDVRIFFTGLLILDPNPEPGPGVNPEKSCEVFVNRSAPDHHLSIEVRRKREGYPDIIMMRHLGDLSFGAAAQTDMPRYGMFIDVIGGEHPRGVRRYDPADGAAPSKEGEAFGLAFDLEGPQFHNAKLEIDKPAGRPSIVLNDAVFYTAVKTQENKKITLAKKDIETDSDVVVVEKLPPFASVIGANIYLDDDDEAAVLMSWRQQGRDKLLTLKKPTGDFTYEIYIANEPLYEADDSPFSTHDEFGEYYRLFPKVPIQDRFRVFVPDEQPEEPDAERGSTTTPCMPIVVGGGGGSN